MRPQPKIRQVATSTDTALVAATETVIVTLPGISVQSPDVRVKLHGWAQVSNGAGGNTLQLAVRRGTTVAGTLVGEINSLTHAASSTVDASIDVSDTPGDVAGQSYVLTAQEIGSAGTALQAALDATY